MVKVFFSFFLSLKIYFLRPKFYFNDQGWVVKVLTFGGDIILSWWLIAWKKPISTFDIKICQNKTFISSFLLQVLECQVFRHYFNSNHYWIVFVSLFSLSVFTGGRFEIAAALPLLKKGKRECSVLFAGIREIDINQNFPF